MSDLSETIAPTSDQLDAVDLLTGPRTFTIERVEVKAGAEQPVSIRLREFPRVWRPGKSMRRVLVACWGADSAAYAGRRVTLYCDPKVRFGGAEVGGTRISHLSHIDRPKSVPLLISRGKSEMFVVKPLPDAPEQPAEPKLSTRNRGRLFALFAAKGIPEDQQLAGIAHVIGRTPSHRDAINEDEFARVVADLEKLPDAEVQS